MSENSIEFSLSNSEQRDSWLNSGHWTLDADTRGVLRVCAIPDKCFPVFSAEVSEGNSSGEVGEVRHIYSK